MQVLESDSPSSVRTCSLGTQASSSPSRTIRSRKKEANGADSWHRAWHAVNTHGSLSPPSILPITLQSVKEAIAEGNNSSSLLAYRGRLQGTDMGLLLPYPDPLCKLLASLGLFFLIRNMGAKRLQNPLAGNCKVLQNSLDNSSEY